MQLAMSPDLGLSEPNMKSSLGPVLKVFIWRLFEAIFQPVKPTSLLEYRENIAKKLVKAGWKIDQKEPINYFEDRP